LSGSGSARKKKKNADPQHWIIVSILEEQLPLTNVLILVRRVLGSDKQKNRVKAGQARKKETETRIQDTMDTRR
jgi:hypothetical protein